MGEKLERRTWCQGLCRGAQCCRMAEQLGQAAGEHPWVGSQSPPAQLCHRPCCGSLFSSWSLSLLRQMVGELCMTTGHLCIDSRSQAAPE